MNEKLILVTRADLSPAQQAVQSAHALRQFAQEHPTEDKDWFEQSNHLALLSVQDEPELHRLQERAWDLDVPCSAFYEPDLGGAITALAFAPGAGSRRLVRALPLALQGAIAEQPSAPEGSSRRIGCTDSTDSRVCCRMRRGSFRRTSDPIR